MLGEVESKEICTADSADQQESGSDTVAPLQGLTGGKAAKAKAISNCKGKKSMDCHYKTEFLASKPSNPKRTCRCPSVCEMLFEAINRP